MLPSHWACRANATEIALKLLEIHSEGVKVQNNEGEFSLHVACKKNTTENTLKRFCQFPRVQKFKITKEVYHYITHAKCKPIPKSKYIYWTAY
jgi:hypothetical protein